MLNDLKVTELDVGVIINFKNRKLEWERLVLDEARDDSTANPRE
jgi:hypothetical protein